MQDKNQWNLNDKMQYWKEHPDDEGMLGVLFSQTECRILDTFRQFETFDELITQKLKRAHLDGSVAETFIRVEEEAELSFRLKGYFIEQMDFLLAKGTPEAWMDIMIWYSLLEERKFIIQDYWEFPALRKMIDVFMKELNAFLARGKTFHISILSLHSMEELMDAYFRVIFLCRRVEYGIEPMKEIVEYIKKKKFSDVFISGIIEKAQIYNEGKVIKMIEEQCWR